MLARGHSRDKRAGLIAAALATVIFGAPAAAQQAGCPPSRTPIKLNFKTVAPDPIYNHQLNLNGIANRSRSSGAAAEVTSRPVGLTAVNTMFGVKGGSSVVGRGPSWCSYLTSVEVTFGWEGMEVFVPSEYPRGSCEYRAVVDHENQHVSIIRSTLREFAPVARARIEAVLAKSRPIASGKEGNIDQALAPVHAELNRLLNEFNSRHGARSANIDTPSNYKATTALCKNWDGQRR